MLIPLIENSDMLNSILDQAGDDLNREKVNMDKCDEQLKEKRTEIEKKRTEIERLNGLVDKEEQECEVIDDNKKKHKISTPETTNGAE